MLNNQKESEIKELLKESPQMPQAGDLVEGKIIKISSASIVLDLGSFGTGIIYGGEIKENREIFKNLKVGDTLSGLVLDPENDEGFVELSLQKATVEKTWSELKDKKQSGEPIAVRVTEANRGGLIVKFSSIVGFLPVSQLSMENYPRVEGGDKSKILNHLNQFIGKELKVKIISLNQKDNKLIVSEKALSQKKTKESLEKYKEGDVVEGIVTSLTNFGAFIKFDEGLEGLAHISELDWQIIDHPNQVVKENEKVKAQIVNIQDGQISLSLKALKQDPWQNIESEYQDGQIISGQVTKFSPSGAIIKIGDKIHGLVHISEFSKQNQPMEQILKLGGQYDFRIVSLTPKTHKMSLALTKENSSPEL